ncbi:WRKY transcription factor 53 [Tripterygium wilfordii]|uniref:WRKY transcription factor 53 n=1 Tax=Tripterygium wilfordii TaxID=458696 RepID=A0A7J7CE92_TRIWF|nr:probable WRKY transcription factor 53 [Tripterygium wilfordii]KAF5732410.1 WRKY transcription factor 53 [Tripterygium wilfordii]
MGDWEQKKHLINELAEGRELAKQLQSHLNLPSSPNENGEVLVQKIIATYEKALSMLNCSVGTSSTVPGAAAIGFSESPPSLNGSPRSDQDSDPEHRNAGLGKRKSMQKWTKQVRVSPGMGIEGPLEDGFSWRKYGQKDILGAKHPRAYYRCTHRPVRGCLATKQVQRSDEDPTILEFTYRGRHTCKQSTINSSTHSPPPPPQQNQSEEQLLLMNYLCPENQFFPVQNNLAEDFAPSFLSPATSGTGYFSVSPNGLNTSHQNFQSNEADQFSEIFSSSAATSGTNSPTIGLDFQFGNANQFDTHFTFDHPGSLS